VCKSEENAHREEPENIGAALGDFPELIIDEVSQEEATPEELLEYGHHDDEPNEAKAEEHAGGQGIGGDLADIETVCAGREAEKCLRRDPDHEYGDSDADREDPFARQAQSIAGAITPENPTANNGLQGHDPISGLSHPERGSGCREITENFPDQEKPHEDHKSGDVMPGSGSFFRGNAHCRLVLLANTVTVPQLERNSPLMPDPPDDPNKFLKLIEMDLERRRRELPTSNRRSIFTWRVLAILFLMGAAMLAWWMLDVARDARDRQGADSAPPIEEVSEPSSEAAP